MTSTPQTIRLADYRVPDYLIPALHLTFDLHEEWAVVTARLQILPNPAGVAGAPLRLDGQGLELLAVALDGKKLAPTDYQAEAEALTLAPLTAAGELEITTKIRPQENEALEGLYRSSGNFCTQCEAQGFRKITYFLDRPDVMSRYTTTIVADRRRYPVLLANGNLLAQEAVAGARHSATWEDPFPKPAYLFALVAGNLTCIEERYRTKSGRQVALQIYVQPHNASKCGHAMASLVKAMRWDEEVYGLEYDLDQFMIVAVDDFNMGAMENKGLNIFNSKYILAEPATATDDDYFGIERVVAHEYFHNWTGNRVTCRDWFQLSLKEGLTVFRDQEFSADMASRPVQRIHDVVTLRNHQFPEDASPMAHPIRPASYIEINNFYTVTVYEKGAEVIRMLHTLLGAATFRKGMDLYFARHDGQAVTTDDFVQALEDAWSREPGGPNQGLAQFRSWYSQAGTPELAVGSSYDAESQVYSLTVEQIPATVAGQEARMLHIPLAVGLLDPEGVELPLTLVGQEGRAPATTLLLASTRATETFHFANIGQRPLPSLLRDFSAPVKLRYDYSAAELRQLLLHDRDPFNRWEAGQRIYIDALQGLMAEYRQGRELRLDPELVAVVKTVLAADFHPDKAFVSQLLTLPSEEYLAELMVEVEVEAIHAARQFMRRELACQLRPLLEENYEANCNLDHYRYDAGLAGQRQLKNLSLEYLLQINDEGARALAVGQLRVADNMSDEYGALRALAHADCPQRRPALLAFYEKWQHDPLVVDKWFVLQATAPLPSTLAEVKDLLDHPAFTLKVPNKVRSLIGSFAGGNPSCFHERSGAGYRFLADLVLQIDVFNAQIAARLLGRLSRWRQYDPARRQLMQAELARILAQPGLSKGCYEVAQKSLN